MYERSNAFDQIRTVTINGLLDLQRLGIGLSISMCASSRSSSSRSNGDIWTTVRRVLSISYRSLTERSETLSNKHGPLVACKDANISPLYRGITTHVLYS